MLQKQLEVTFQPIGRKVFVLAGTSVLEAAARAGLTIDTPCGGGGICGRCRVRFSEGAPVPGDQDGERFTPEKLDEGWRLACHTYIEKSCSIHVPEDSLFSAQLRIITSRSGGSMGELLPAVRKQRVEMNPPSLEDSRADLLRLQQQTGPVKVSLDMLRRLAPTLREGAFCGTAVLAESELIDFHPGDTTDRCLGVAIDIGTTTLAGSLLDLVSGKELALSALANPQSRFGDDVLTRIRHAGESPQGLDALRDTIIEAVNTMVEDLCGQAELPTTEIYEVVFAGNTTMQHLLCGLDPSPLGQIPFVPAFARGLSLSASELRLSVHRGARAQILPIVGGFVGGDTVAGLVATRIGGMDGPEMLVDIGTNGEIVLACEGELWAASTSAGPAFEGARISCGMRAVPGAVEKVVFDDDIRLSTIGDDPARGICGSALVDLVAQLLDCGILTPEGRMLARKELPADLPARIAERVLPDENGQHEFLVACEGDGGGRRVVVTQRDIREMQLATGAIRAGINLLLRQVGIEPTDLVRVCIAGGFGSFIRRDHAQRIGLITPGIPHRRIHFVGNASLDGAKWAMLSTSARKQAEVLAGATRHVNLSQDPAFQDAFAEAMIFPASPQADAEGSEAGPEPM